MKTIKRYWQSLLLIAAAGLPCAQSVAADIDFGKPGSPVELVVGYQPYYTESWSGVVMRGKKFYEKYLPKGSKVEFQIGLQAQSSSTTCSPASSTSDTWETCRP